MKIWLNVGIQGYFQATAHVKIVLKARRIRERGMAAIETYDGMSYKHSAEASIISTTSFQDLLFFPL